MNSSYTALQRNVYLIYAFSIFTSFSLYRPILIIYLYSVGLSGYEISFVQILLFVVTFAFQVPAGIIADKYGKKLCLIIYVALMLAHAIGMIFFYSFSWITILFALYGLSIAFSEAPATALLYDSLKAIGKEDKYEFYLSRKRILSTISLSVALVAGGYLYTWGGVAAIFGVYFVVYLISLPIAALFYEMRPSEMVESRGDKPESVAAGSDSVLSFLANPSLRPFIIFVGSYSLFIAMLVPYYIYAPKMFVDLGYSENSIGWAFSIVEILTCFALYVSGTISFKNNVQYYTLLGMFATSIALLLHLCTIGWLPFLIFCSIFVIPEFISVHINKFINDKLPDDKRATLLSVEHSLAGLFVSLGYLYYGVLDKFLPMYKIISLSSVILLISCLLGLYAIWYGSRKEAVVATLEQG